MNKFFDGQTKIHGRELLRRCGCNICLSQIAGGARHGDAWIELRDTKSKTVKMLRLEELSTSKRCDFCDLMLQLPCLIIASTAAKDHGDVY